MNYTANPPNPTWRRGPEGIIWGAKGWSLADKKLGELKPKKNGI
jgi:hypothetical protein